MKYVIDANIVIDWIVLSENVDLPVHKIFGLAILKRIELYTPSFLISEVCNVLKQRYKYSEEKISSVIKKLDSLDLRYLEMSSQDWPKLLKISFQYNLTIYDSYYLLASLQTKTKLITSDKALLTTDLGISPKEAVDTHSK